MSSRWPFHSHMNHSHWTASVEASIRKDMTQWHEERIASQLSKHASPSLPSCCKLISFWDTSIAAERCWIAWMSRGRFIVFHAEGRTPLALPSSRRFSAGFEKIMHRYTPRLVQGLPASLKLSFGSIRTKFSPSETPCDRTWPSLCQCYPAKFTPLFPPLLTLPQHWNLNRPFLSGEWREYRRQAVWICPRGSL